MQNHQLVPQSKVEPRKTDASDNWASVFFYSTKIECILYAIQLSAIFCKAGRFTAGPSGRLPEIIIGQNRFFPYWEGAGLSAGQKRRYAFDARGLLNCNLIVFLRNFEEWDKTCPIHVLALPQEQWKGVSA